MLPSYFLLTICN